MQCLGVLRLRGAGWGCKNEPVADVEILLEVAAEREVDERPFTCG
jgi:hypothetical protein